MNFLLTYRSLDDNIHRHLKWIRVCLCLIDSQFDGTRVTVVTGPPTICTVFNLRIMKTVAWPASC